MNSDHLNPDNHMPGNIVGLVFASPADGEVRRKISFFIAVLVAACLLIAWVIGQQPDWLRLNVDLLRVDHLGVLLGSAAVALVFIRSPRLTVLILVAGATPSIFVVAAAVMLWHVALPIANGCSQSIWQIKTPPDVQGRVFAVRRLIAQFTVPLGDFSAGPLSDYVFEPMMAEGGALAGTLGPIIGTGPGRGIGLMMLVFGVFPIVAAGLTGSFFIVSANAWMNSPTGFTLTASGGITNVDPWAAMLNPATGVMMKPTVLGGKPLDIAPEDDPRHELAKWLRSPDNPYFSQMVVNRYWKHFFGRGMVEPEDDIRVTNPPSHPQLLDGLARWQYNILEKIFSNTCTPEKKQFKGWKADWAIRRSPRLLLPVLKLRRLLRSC